MRGRTGRELPPDDGRGGRRARRRTWPHLGRVAVAGDSMLPTLHDGDWLLVAYGAPIRPGAVVVVRLPDRPLGVKRAVRREAGGWWVEGDAADHSTDSRVFGPVGAGDVVGRVVWRYRPLVRREA